MLGEEVRQLSIPYWDLMHNLIGLAEGYVITQLP